MYTRTRGGPKGASSGFGLWAKTLRGQGAKTLRGQKPCGGKNKLPSLIHRVNIKSALEDQMMVWVITEIFAVLVGEKEP